MRFWPFNKVENVPPARLEPTLDAAAPRNDMELSTMESWGDLMTSLSNHPAGVAVNERTAMRISAVYACVRVIGGAIGSLPLPVFKGTTTGRDKATEHPLWELLNYEPNPGMTAMSFREFGMQQVLLQGDWISWIQRNRNGEPQGIFPFPSRNVRIQRLGGKLIYHFTMDEGATFSAHQDDVLHVPGVGFNGMRSLSCIQGALGWSAGIALAADEQSARMFSNGMAIKGAIKYPKKVDETQARLIQDYVMRMQSGVENAGKPLILTEGGEFVNASMTAVDAQLIEQKKLQITDIARIFGVPPHLIGETEKSTSWGSGIEQQSIGFVQYSLSPHLVRIEQEINRKLFRGTDHFVEFNVDGLLRGDSKARAEALRQARGGSQGPGWASLNECRAIMNMPPVADGDEIYNPKSEDMDDEGKSNAAPSEQSEGEPESVE